MGKRSGKQGSAIDAAYHITYLTCDTALFQWNLGMREFRNSD